MDPFYGVDSSFLQVNQSSDTNAQGSNLHTDSPEAGFCVICFFESVMIIIMTLYIARAVLLFILAFEEEYSQRLSITDIGRLPTRKYGYRESGSGTGGTSKVPGQNKCCPICSKCYENGDILKVLPCCHEYHLSCVDVWISQKDPCLVCKTVVDVAIRSLPVKKYGGYVCGVSEPCSRCPVCLADYESGDILKLLPCSHEFHVSCADRWLLFHDTCPLCRKLVEA